MGDSDVSILWENFHSNMTYRLKQQMNEKAFSDITLVTKDNKKIPVHRLILSSGSTFFRDLFSEDLGHPHPLLYLRGVGQDVLEAVLQFLYIGQVQLKREQVKEFLAMAEDLGVEGLVKDMDHRNNFQNETKYFANDNFPEIIEEEVVKGVYTSEKPDSIFPDEDDWFKKVNYQNNEKKC